MLLRQCDDVISPLKQWLLTTATPAIVLFSILCLVAMPGLSQIKTYCSEPVTPFCVNRAGVFEDSTAQERCRIEVDKYVEGMEQYAACVGEQQKEARTRAAEIEERFACMSRGEANCR